MGPGMDEPERTPRMLRSKTTELTIVSDTRFHLVARLTDVAHGGRYVPAAPSATIHDFTVEGDLDGDDLVIASLTVTAGAHPYGGCPAVVPRGQELVGSSLASGWRRLVLSTMGATSGCTHVTTLLLGLAEARTMAFFLRMNERETY